MKWVIFVSLLCFLSLAELKNLPRRYRNTDDHHWTIRLASQISANDFGAIVLVLFAQALPNTTLEELKTLSANVKAIHQKCVDNQYSSPECTKPLGIVFLDLLCHDEEFSKKYGINDCCAKSDPERHACVLSHKISAIGSVSPFVRPTAEEACQAYHNDRNDVLAHHLYEISRRNARAPVTVLSAATKSFDKILETCCKEVEKDTCIEGKATVVRNKAREIIDEQENTCFNLENYGKETLYELKFIQIAEKFINANLEILTHIAKEVVHIHEATCKGDSLGTLLDRADLSEYVCKHKNDISHNLDHCCEKGLVERSQCIVTKENDPLSPDLPTPSGETFKETACQYYVEHGSINKESFLLALIRTHPELSQLFDLEILHRYGDTLEKCCKREDKVQCLNDGEEQNRLYVKKISDIVKNNCNNYKEIGEYFFQNE
ncbi:PREDICTED: serum albumin-like [Thamnophis sirtalis]|uniref:Serum albumin-like n=1 Tax=Thamnophis sirtalis TaxID=35019 RepID=A0A6I9XFN9_9SAUR|nr:PREDICTED: serum albumin-like [Thamnophis sirtalis]